MRRKQLYKLIPDIEYPAMLRLDYQTGEIISTTDKREGFYSFVWPNGTTCFLVEIFLADLSDTTKISKADGGTVGTYAKNLSHLVRYCFDCQVDFWDLTHSHIDDLVSRLSNEVNAYGERVRNNNTIIGSLAHIVTFLKWVQKEYCTNRNLIGVDTKLTRYQIKLKAGVYRKRYYSNSYEVFPYKLPSATQDPKRPISSAIIKKLWEALAKDKLNAGINKRLQTIFSKQEQKDHILYMYNRRAFQLIMLEATGLRPQELITIKASSNQRILDDSKIEIPTLKREKSSRIIPIDNRTRIKVQIFLEVHREKLIKRLIKHGMVSDVNEIDDVIFLNPETGKMVKPDAAYMEFKRLSNKAGINQKNCQSMFRHRFVTNMVKLNLISFMDKNPAKSRYNFAESDYRTILTKVATFTGHKDPESLLHYIDLAWDELDAFSFAYEVDNLHSKLRSISRIVSGLKGEVEGGKGLHKTKILSLVDEALNEIEAEVELTTRSPC